MQNLITTLILICVLSAVAIEASDQKNIQVITQTSTVDKKEAGGKITFVSGQVVEVIERTETMALVREAEMAQSSAWVPRKLLVTVKDFLPIWTWQGEKIFHWCTESYDSCITYHANNDGMFKAVIVDTSEPEPQIWYGRLHKKGRLLWAKPNKNQHQYFIETSCI